MPHDRKASRTRAVFLDRDGIIIKDTGYIGEIARVKFIPGAGRAIKELNERRFKVIIVTNQAGVARGYFNEDAVRRVNSYIQKKLAEEEAAIDGIYYCPHHAEGVIEKYRRECNCRKPKTGMLEKAASDFNIDLKNSFLIGDKESDIEAGCRAGCHTILVAGTGQEIQVNPDYTAHDLYEAVKWLLKFDKEKHG